MSKRKVLISAVDYITTYHHSNKSTMSAYIYVQSKGAIHSAIKQLRSSDTGRTELLIDLLKAFLDLISKHTFNTNDIKAVRHIRSAIYLVA